MFTENLLKVKDMSKLSNITSLIVIGVLPLADIFLFFDNIYFLTIFNFVANDRLQVFQNFVSFVYKYLYFRRLFAVLWNWHKVITGHYTLSSVSHFKSLAFCCNEVIFTWFPYLSFSLWKALALVPFFNGVFSKCHAKAFCKCFNRYSLKVIASLEKIVLR